MHPSLEYMLVCCLAATVSLLLTPIVRRVALRWGAVAHPRDRDVHAVDTPRLGGVASHANPRINEAPYQPRPDGSLMIDGVSRR